jgi:hypothetical protein
MTRERYAVKSFELAYRGHTRSHGSSWMAFLSRSHDVTSVKASLATRTPRVDLHPFGQRRAVRVIERLFNLSKSIRLCENDEREAEPRTDGRSLVFKFRCLLPGGASYWDDYQLGPRE